MAKKKKRQQTKSKPNKSTKQSSSKKDPTSLRQLGNTFRRIVDVLNDAQIRYVVIGALAVRAYIPTRSSNDVDLLVSRANLDRIVRLAHKDFKHVKTRIDEVAVLRDRRTDVEVHLRAAIEKSDKQALGSAITIGLFSRPVRIPAPEYLAVMKLASMRGQRKHWEDVISLVKADCIDVRFVLAHLVRQHPHLIDLFVELVAAATPKQRVKRP